MDDDSYLERTPFDIWQWEMEGFVLDLVDTVSQSHWETYTDADGSILKRQLERWFAEGMTTEEAAERIIASMARLGVFRKKVTWAVFPTPPRFPNGKSMEIYDGEQGGYYHVFNEGELAAAYNLMYFHSVEEVIIDLLDRIKTEEVKGKWGSDFVIWFSGRVLAVLHEPMVGTRLQVVRFTEERNDPGSPGPHHIHRPGWPTYEQWVDSGKGPLWYDEHNRENPVDRGGGFKNQEGG